MRRIIILESNPQIPGEPAFRYAMWADVPAGRESRYANPSFTSQVVGATGPEIAALQAGSVVERVFDSRWGTGSTVPQIQAQLVAKYGQFQAEITGTNPWQRYGTSYDGTAWTMVNNP